MASPAYSSNKTTTISFRIVMVLDLSVRVTALRELGSNILSTRGRVRTLVKVLGLIEVYIGPYGFAKSRVGTG